MYEVLTSVEIDAPRERVWSVLESLPQYDEWNPFMTRLRGRLATGEPFEFYGTVEGRDYPIEARFVDVRPGEEIRWAGPRSKLLGKLFGAEHFFRLETLPSSRTRFVHGERFRGLVMPVMWKHFEPRIRKAYEAMNAALKRRVESGS